MLNKAEIKELTTEGSSGYFVSLYLNVDPFYNKKGDYVVHFKNLMKNTIENLDKSVYKKVKGDLEKIEHFVLGNKKMFRKGLALVSSSENALWKEFHLAVPFKNEIVIDTTPYARPLLDIMDSHPRYAVLLVNKESARIFMVHLGEIVEYGEVHTDDVPGKHKKGGWFALSQNHYERHIAYHVGLHLKDVLEKLDSFLSREYVGRIIISGTEESVSMLKGMLQKSTLDKVIGIVKIGMYAKPDEVLSKIEPVVQEYEEARKEEAVSGVIAKALKNELAVVGLDNVLNALQEQRVMKIVMLKNYTAGGFICKGCSALIHQKIHACPYCRGTVAESLNIAESIGERAIQQGAQVVFVSKSAQLSEAGGIGALLRF